MTNPMSTISQFHADRVRDDLRRGRGGNGVPPAPRSDRAGAAPGAHRAPHAADTPLPLAARVLFWLAAATVFGGLVVAWIN
ncbi:hypothetical protein J2X65_000684 [Ancylobacter sp. 3268]|uniref:hypothetical protein n=1 Tax=Ancylobacter sp. 3268 TaxID=2817752 RepID=UPI0028597C67|nr:hypothetical protein [Ancylobacter sp. 3268]MDR6951336.1 hypothetical protein [Ancylobacter sp. 3268]